MRNKKSARAKILKDLSEGFQQRTIPGDYMDDPNFRAAYGEYYGEVGFEKGLNLSSEILERLGPGVFRGRTPLRILDLGTGTGAFLRGVLAGLEGIGTPLPDLDILCIDRSLSALQDLEKNWKTREGVRLRVKGASLPGPEASISSLESVDLVLMANVLAENEERLLEFASMFGLIAGRMNEGGVLLLVEPADRRASRALLRLGDQLRAIRSDLRIVAPCPNGRTGTCPALRDIDNWCHEDRPARFSGDLRRSALMLGHVKDALKMSYLMFLKGTLTPLVPSLRLVSTLKKEKGLVWGVFCQGEDLVRIRLLKRDRSDSTRPFTRLKKGDSIVLPPFMKDNTLSLRTGSRADWPEDEAVIRLTGADGRPYRQEEDAPSERE
jgi:SAM-dependent methyltransferase